MSNLIKKTTINISLLYTNVIITTLIAFFTTKIVLQFLGEADFGLYSLIGGVAMMLSFLNSSLLQSTQRFLSISIGHGNTVETRQVFNSSFMLHILMSMVLIIIFLTAQPLLFNGFLNIPTDRIDTAISIYYIVTITTIITFFTTPYDSAINAREEMWFFAITDTIKSILILISVIIIMYIGYNSEILLKIYTVAIMLSVFVSFVIKMIWCSKRYSECHLSRKLLCNKKQMRMQLGFTGWNTFVTFAAVCRDQGIAVVINVFYGTVVNAAYGVARQINALIGNVSSTISMVFAPQIIQSYGSENRERMLNLAIFSSKIALFLSAIVGFPFLLESQTILDLWLDKVPEYASVFCELIIVLFLIQQCYPGLIKCLYAQGDIKWYQVIVSTTLILPVFIGYGLFMIYDFQPQVILYLMIIGQFVALIATVHFAKIKVGLNVSSFYLSSVFKPVSLFVFIYILLANGKILIDNDIVRLVVVSFISTILLMLQFYIFILNRKEKNQFRIMFNQFKNKFKK